jgi:hypothetical protein
MDKDKQLEELQTENAELKQWVSDLQSGMYINCVYCGHRFGPAESTPVSMADTLKEHVENCPKHPMSKLKADIKTLQNARQHGNYLLKKKQKNAQRLDKIIRQIRDNAEEAKVSIAKAMEDNMRAKLLQIIPANDWWAMMESKHKKISFVPLMAWAIVEIEIVNTTLGGSSTHRDFVGLTKTGSILTILEESDNFVMYCTAEQMKKIKTEYAKDLVDEIYRRVAEEEIVD